MLTNSVRIRTSRISCLPTDSIHGTCGDGVVDILSLIDITCLHARESFVVEFEYIARYSSTGTTAYTSTIDVWFSQRLLECIEGVSIHRRRGECWDLIRSNCKLDLAYYREMSIIRKNKFLFSFSSYSMKFARIFDFSLRLLLVFLPFSTLLSVFCGEKLGIP